MDQHRRISGYDAMKCTEIPVSSPESVQPNTERAYQRQHEDSAAKQVLVNALWEKVVAAVASFCDFVRQRVQRSRPR